MFLRDWSPGSHGQSETVESSRYFYFSYVQLEDTLGTPDESSEQQN